MRKIILLSFAFLSVEIFAQKSFLGVDAGINVANHRVVAYPTPVITSPNFVPGPTYFQDVVKSNVGIFYQYNFVDKVGCRLGAEYTTLGHKDRFDSNYDVTLNYLRFPLSFRYYANKHLSLAAGPYLSFTIDNSKMTIQTIPGIPAVPRQSVTSFYHKNDFGFSLGIEHDVYKNLALACNYIIGTKNIWLNDSNGAVKYNNRAIQLLLIYKFKKPS